MKVVCPKCNEEIEVAVMPEIITTGLDFEDFLYRHINAQDGLICEKTKASGDQGVDLIVMAGDKKIAVQCKLYTEPVGNSAVQEVIAGKIVYKCDLACVVTNSTFTKAAADLAKAAEIELLNYKECIKYFLGIAGVIDERDLFGMRFDKAISNEDFKLAERLVDSQASGDAITLLLNVKRYFEIYAASDGVHKFDEYAIRKFAECAELLAMLSCAESKEQTESYRYLQCAESFFRECGDRDASDVLEKMVARMYSRGEVNWWCAKYRQTDMMTFIGEAVDSGWFKKLLSTDVERVSEVFDVYTCDEPKLLQYANDGNQLAVKILKGVAEENERQARAVLMEGAIDEAKSGKYERLFKLIREGCDIAVKAAMEIAKSDYNLMVELASMGFEDAKRAVIEREEFEGGVYAFISRIRAGDVYAKERLKCLVRALSLEEVAARNCLSNDDVEFVRQIIMEGAADS